MMERIFTKGSAFVDEAGRTRIFNGANLCSKDFRKDNMSERTKFPMDLDDAFFATYVQNGFNVLRLGVCWDELEHEMGKINEPYLQSLDAIFAKAAQWGVYIFLDMHQDLYGSFDKEHCGNGAPKWAYLSEPYEPKPAKWIWPEGYFWGKAVHRAFDNFWANKEVEGRGVQDRYADLWRLLARRCGESSALLGYDVMNEPFPGSIGGKMFRKLILSIAKNVLFNKKLPAHKMLGDLLSKKRRGNLLNRLDGNVIPDITKAANKLARQFGTESFTPFLQRMTRAIRAETQHGVILFEHNYFGNIGVPLQIEPIAVDGKPEASQGYSPHAYDFMVDTPGYVNALDSRVQAFFDAARQSQLQMDVPVLVGEWGGGQEPMRHVQFLLDLFDRYGWSQAYYCYHYFSEEILRELNRTYPAAVTGEIKRYGFDRAAQCFTLEYLQTEATQAETVLYLHAPPKKVEADGEVNQYSENGADYLKIKTEPGEHRVAVYF